MNKKDIATLKGEGYLIQKDGEHFSVRVLSSAGNMTSEQLRNLAYIAEIYGRNYLGFTTRLCVEIPWIKAEDIDKVKEKLENFGFKSGGTGKRVRPIVSCKGTVCVHGIVDTQNICRNIHNKFFAKELPHKFKIGIVGCPNNCAKANLNDLGFMGQRVPEFKAELCKACGLCISQCKSKAIEKDKDGKAIWNKEKCVNCGDCIKVCPVQAIDVKEEGLAVFIGGRFGRKYRVGTKLDKLVSETEVYDIAEKVMKCYEKYGNDKERFADTIDRIGIENINKEIFR